MSEALTKIVACSFELFLKYGIRSVSMNDIARELGVSKKTLYQHIENKAELVHLTVQYHLSEETKCVENILEDHKNAIDDWIKIGDYVSNQLNSVTPSTMYDLRKYYRKSWELVEQHRTEFIFSIIASNLKKGIAEGLYRPNIKIDIIARIYINTVKGFLEGDFFKDSIHEPVEVYKGLLKYHLYGIATKKGRTYFKNVPFFDEIRKNK